MSTTTDPMTELKVELASLKERVTDLEAEMDQLDDLHTLASMQRSLKDYEEGRFKPAREALDELRRKHKIPSK